MMTAILMLGIDVKAQERHQMSNSHVTINTKDYRSSRSTEIVNEGSRDFIKGKNKVYDNAKNGTPSKLLQPYAEYAFKSKLAGGTFRVTITYKIDSKERKENKNASRKIRLGLDEKTPMEFDLKDSSSGYLKVTQDFKISFLRGKNHVLKLWLPSKGVMVDKIDIRKKIF